MTSTRQLVLCWPCQWSCMEETPVALERPSQTSFSVRRLDWIDKLRKPLNSTIGRLWYLKVETVKKFSAGSNKTGAGQDAAKLDRETEELHHDRYSFAHNSSRTRCTAYPSENVALWFQKVIESAFLGLVTLKLTVCSKILHDCLALSAAFCRVPTELKKKIQQARLEKKLTQAQLGNLINEKPSVITEYENGKAIPSPQVLSKLSRVLGVQLSAKKK